MPADIPCQNQIHLLTGASFIQWVVLCTHPFNYLCLNKKTALKEKKPYDLLYSWYLRSRCFIFEKQSFGLSPSQRCFGMSRNAPFPFSEALRDVPKEGDYHLASAMDSQSRTKGIFFDLQNFSTRNSPSVFPYLVKLNDNSSYHGLREPIRKLENHYPEPKIY